MRRGNEVSQSDVISQLRFPLIVLVTYAHSYSSVAPDFQLLVSGWSTYEVLKLLVSQTLAKLAVPVFFIISGYLFFYNVEEWGKAIYLRKLRRRVKSLLIPYIVWNLLMAVKLGRLGFDMFWVYQPRAGVQTDWLGHEHWMTAPCNMPLWFLRDLMVVSLLTPLFHAVLRRHGTVVMSVLTVVYLSGIGAFAVPGLSMYAVYFFGLGALFGIRKQPLPQLVMPAERLAYAATALLALAMLLTYHTPVFSSVMLCFRLVGAVAVLCLSCRLLSRSSWRLPAVVGASSYFIYLCHFVFFLSFIDTAFFRLYGTSGTALSVHYLLAPVLKIVVYVAAYSVYLKFCKRKTMR